MKKKSLRKFSFFAVLVLIACVSAVLALVPNTPLARFVAEDPVQVAEAAPDLGDGLWGSALTGAEDKALYSTTAANPQEWAITESSTWPLGSGDSKAPYTFNDGYNDGKSWSNTPNGNWNNGSMSAVVGHYVYADDLTRTSGTNNYLDSLRSFSSYNVYAAGQGDLKTNGLSTSDMWKVQGTANYVPGKETSAAGDDSNHQKHLVIERKGGGGIVMYGLYYWNLKLSAADQAKINAGKITSISFQIRCQGIGFDADKPNEADIRATYFIIPGRMDGESSMKIRTVNAANQVTAFAGVPGTHSLFTTSHGKGTGANTAWDKDVTILGGKLYNCDVIRFGVYIRYYMACTSSDRYRWIFPPGVKSVTVNQEANAATGNVDIDYRVQQHGVRNMVGINGVQLKANGTTVSTEYEVKNKTYADIASGKLTLEANLTTEAKQAGYFFIGWAVWESDTTPKFFKTQKLDFSFDNAYRNKEKVDTNNDITHLPWRWVFNASNGGQGKDKSGIYSICMMVGHVATTDVNKVYDGVSIGTPSMQATLGEQETGKMTLYNPNNGYKTSSTMSWADAGVSMSAGYEFQENGQTNAGAGWESTETLAPGAHKYRASVTANGETVYGTANYTITKRPVTVTDGAEVTFEYNGEPQRPSSYSVDCNSAVAPGVTLGESDIVVSAGNTNANTAEHPNYELTLTLPTEKAKYYGFGAGLSDTYTISYTITPKPLVFGDWVSTLFTYNAESQGPALDDTAFKEQLCDADKGHYLATLNLEGEDVLNATQAGKYTITVRFAGNDASHLTTNYTFTAGSAVNNVSVQWEIRPVQLGTTFTESLLYNGYEQSPDIQITGWLAGEGGDTYYTITNKDQLQGSDAKTYSVTYTVNALGGNATSNYCFAAEGDASTAWGSTYTYDKTIEWTITPLGISLKPTAKNSVYGEAVQTFATTDYTVVESADGKTSWPLTDPVSAGDIQISVAFTGNPDRPAVGNYTITMDWTGGSEPSWASNYTVTFVPNEGGYTVTSRVVDYTLALQEGNLSSVYGTFTQTSAPQFGGSATHAGVADTVFTEEVMSGTIALDFAYGAAWSSANALQVGSYPVTARLTGDGAGNYTFSSNTITLSVTPAPITATLDDATVEYGEAIPYDFRDESGILSGDDVTLVGALEAYAALPYAPVSERNGVTVTLSGADSDNYTAPTVTGTVTITPRAITMTVHATGVYGSTFLLERGNWSSAGSLAFTGSVAPGSKDFVADGVTQETVYGALQMAAYGDNATLASSSSHLKVGTYVLTLQSTGADGLSNYAITFQHDGDPAEAPQNGTADDTHVVLQVTPLALQVDLQALNLPFASTVPTLADLLAPSMTGTVDPYENIFTLTVDYGSDNLYDTWVDANGDRQTMPDGVQRINAAPGTTFTVTYAQGGADSANYTLTAGGTGSVIIIKRSIKPSSGTAEEELTYGVATNALSTKLNGMFTFTGEDAQHPFEKWPFTVTLPTLDTSKDYPDAGTYTAQASVLEDYERYYDMGSAYGHLKVVPADYKVEGKAINGSVLEEMVLVSGAEKVYDGSPIAPVVTINGTQYAQDATLADGLDSSQLYYYLTTEAGIRVSSLQLEAGDITYHVHFATRNATANNYNAIPDVTFTVTIAQRPVAVTPQATYTHEYNGQVPTLAGFDIEKKEGERGILSDTEEARLRGFVTLQIEGASSNRGTYTVSVALGAGAEAAFRNYALITDEVKGTLTITQRALSHATITVAPGPYTYNGQSHQPGVSLVDYQLVGADGGPLVLGTDYQVEYGDNVAAGTGTIRISGINNYTTGSETDGVITKSFPIEAKSLLGLTFLQVEVLNAGALIYTGEALVPELKITDTDLNDVLGREDDYTLGTWSNNVNVSSNGLANVSVSITGKGNYKDTQTLSNIATILPRPLDDPGVHAAFKIGTDVQEEYSTTYNGSSQMPDLQVTFMWNTRTEELAQDVSYTVAYSNNVNYGTATVLVTGKGNFSGSTELTFAIGRAAVRVETSDTTLTYNGQVQLPKWSLADFIAGNDPTSGVTVTYRRLASDGVSSEPVDGAIQAGEYVATLTLHDDNYLFASTSAASMQISYRIDPAAIGLSWTLADQTYRPSTQVQGVAVAQAAISGFPLQPTFTYTYYYISFAQAEAWGAYSAEELEESGHWADVFAMSEGTWSGDGAFRFLMCGPVTQGEATGTERNAGYYRAVVKVERTTVAGYTYQNFVFDADTRADDTGLISLPSAVSSIGRGTINVYPPSGNYQKAFGAADPNTQNVNVTVNRVSYTFIFGRETATLNADGTPKEASGDWWEFEKPGTYAYTYCAFVTNPVQNNNNYHAVLGNVNLMISAASKGVTLRETLYKEYDGKAIAADACEKPYTFQFEGFSVSVKLRYRVQDVVDAGTYNVTGVDLIAVDEDGESGVSDAAVRAAILANAYFTPSLTNGEGKYVINKHKIQFRLHDLHKTFGERDEDAYDGDYTPSNLYVVVNPDDQELLEGVGITLTREAGENVRSSGYRYSLELSDKNYEAEIVRTANDGWGGRLYIDPLVVSLREVEGSVGGLIFPDNATKVYDGSASVTVRLAFEGSADVSNIPAELQARVGMRVRATFANGAGAGANKPVQVEFSIPDGAMSDNFDLTELNAKWAATLGSDGTWNAGFFGTVNQALLYATFEDMTFEYGEPHPDAKYSFSGFVSGENQDNIGLTLPAITYGELDTLGVTAPVGTWGGIHFDLVGDGSGYCDNYRIISATTASATITPAPLHVRIRDGVEYRRTADGSNAVELDYSWFELIGLKNGDNLETELRYEAYLSDVVPGFTQVVVRFIDGDIGNYVVTSEPVSVPAYLKATPYIVAQDVVQVYNGQPISAKVTAKVQDPVLGLSDVDYNVTYVKLAESEPAGAEFNDAPITAGTYRMRIVTVATYNYDSVAKDVTIDIQKAKVRITFNGEVTQTYGSFAPLSAQARGVDEQFDDLTIHYPFDPDGVPGAGHHTITAEFAGSENYAPAVQALSIQILPRKLQATFYGYEDLVYNGKQQEIQVSLSGMLEQDGEVAYRIDYSSGVAPRNAGTYTATVVILNPNYTVLGNNMQTFTIAKRKLSVSVDGGTVEAGQQVTPDLYFDGFVEGDGVEDLESVPNVSHGGIKAGENRLSLSGGIDRNYEMELNDGTFTVIYKAPERNTSYVMWFVLGGVVLLFLLILLVARLARRRQEAQYGREYQREKQARRNQ